MTILSAKIKEEEIFKKEGTHADFERNVTHMQSMTYLDSQNTHQYIDLLRYQPATSCLLCMYTLNCCKEVNEGKTLCWFKFKDKAALRNVESEILLDIPPCLLLWLSCSEVVLEEAGKDVFKADEPACKACNRGC